MGSASKDSTTARRGRTAFVYFALLLAAIALAIGQEPREPQAPPGIVEGTGTFFEVTDSDYLNVTLHASEPVTVRLESAFFTIAMSFEASEAPASTQLTLGGLSPLTTYYRYQDSYESGGPITTDATGSFTWAQDLASPHLVWLQPTPSTKYIRDDATGGDCTTIGTWNATAKTCTLTTDVYQSIEISSNGVTLDGAGHLVRGGPGYGIFLSGRSGVTIRSIRVEGFAHGVYLLVQSNNNTLAGIRPSFNGYGITVHASYFNTLTGNTVSSNQNCGISIIQGSGFNTLSDNLVSNHNAAPWAAGIWLSVCHHITLTGNTVSNNSKGIYLEGSGQNLIYHNNFIGNAIQAEVVRNSEVFNLAAPVGGNFWSNWTTPDADGNGFVDLPYIISGGYGRDNLPWTTASGWEDQDQDGVPDLADNCPTVPNTDQADLDGDGQGDACDTDQDGDGVANPADNCPVVSNPDQVDRDGDGLGDACDPDLDGDGVTNANDNCAEVQNPEQGDTDLDGQGDACDSDDDGDGVVDTADNCPFNANPEQFDLDNDGCGDVCDSDRDGDGVLNETDNCVTEPNPYQDNTDGDTLGDACDADDDNDGLCDTDQSTENVCVAGPDNCATVANPDQADFDGDAIGDLCDADVDGDGIENAADNCMWTPNASQDDTDLDGDGDACDPDDDNDTWFDGVDNCPLVYNLDQSDLDGDGLGDACDADLDGDGVDNDVDNCPMLANSGQVDLDGDGLGDACDPDIDGDGVVNETDLCAATPLGVVVDPGNGCSIAQLCPCAGPRGTNQPWKNHGKYVSCVAHASEGFLALGLITEAEKDAIVSAAAQSACGAK